MKLSSKKILSQKKSLVPITLITLVVAAVLVMFAGYNRQQASFSSTTDHYNSVKQLSKTIFEGKRSIKDRVDAIADLANFQQIRPCRGDWWNDWQQTVVPSVTSGVKTCHKQASQLSAIAASAASLNRYEVDDSTIAGQIGKLKIDNTAKNWPQTALKNAQTAYRAIDDIRSTTSSKPVRTAAKGCIKAIIDTWNALNDASTKQDKAVYLNAEVNLKQAYANLGSIADVSDKQLSAQLSVLKTIVNTLSR